MRASCADCRRKGLLCSHRGHKPTALDRVRHGIGLKGRMRDDSPRGFVPYVYHACKDCGVAFETAAERAKHRLEHHFKSPIRGSMRKNARYGRSHGVREVETVDEFFRDEGRLRAKEPVDSGRASVLKLVGIIALGMAMLFIITRYAKP